MTVWDEQIKGLHTITRNGKSSWYVYYRLRDGKQRRSKIGSVNIISVKQAREIAKEILAKVALGRDPFGENKNQKSRLVDSIFIDLVTEHYCQERYIASGHADDVTYLYKKHVGKAFGKKDISKITAPQINTWHKKFSKTPYLGNRAKALLSKIFSFAELKGLLPPGSNPCRAVSSFEEESRRRYASNEEIAKIMNWLRFYDSPFNGKAIVFLKVLLLTGSRINALERARWEDLTMIGGGAILRVQGKTGIDEIVLSNEATKLVEGLPRGNEFIFGKFPKSLWNRIKKETGVKGLWARDFRRTFGTVGLSSGISRGILSELMNHKSEQTTKIYSLLVPKAKLLAANAIAEEIGKMR